jgi:hypothetical protein
MRLTWTRAYERFFAGMRTDVRDEREAGRLCDPSARARLPFTGIIRLVHANVVCNTSTSAGRDKRYELAIVYVIYQ